MLCIFIIANIIVTNSGKNLLRPGFSSITCGSAYGFDHIREIGHHIIHVSLFVFRQCQDISVPPGNEFLRRIPWRLPTRKSYADIVGGSDGSQVTGFASIPIPRPVDFPACDGISAIPILINGR